MLEITNYSTSGTTRMMMTTTNKKYVELWLSLLQQSEGDDDDDDYDNKYNIMGYDPHFDGGARILIYIKSMILDDAG